MFTNLFKKKTIQTKFIRKFLNNLLLNKHKIVNYFFQGNESLELFYHKILYKVDKHVKVQQPKKEYNRHLVKKTRVGTAPPPLH